MSELTFSGGALRQRYGSSLNQHESPAFTTQPFQQQKQISEFQPPRLQKYQNILEKISNEHKLSKEYQNNFEMELDLQLQKLERKTIQSSGNSTALNTQYDQYLKKPLQKSDKSSTDYFNQKYEQYIKNDDDLLSQIRCFDEGLNVQDIISNKETLQFFKQNFENPLHLTIKEFIKVVLEVCDLQFSDLQQKKCFSRLIKERLTTSNDKMLSLNAVEINTKECGMYEFIERIVRQVLAQTKQLKQNTINQQIVEELSSVKQMLEQRTITINQEQEYVWKQKSEMGKSLQQSYDILVKLMEDTYNQKLVQMNKRFNQIENLLKQKLKLIESKGQNIAKRNQNFENENQKLKGKIASLEKQIDLYKQKNCDLEIKLKTEQQQFQVQNQKLDKLNTKYANLEKKYQMLSQKDKSLNDVSINSNIENLKPNEHDESKQLQKQEKQQVEKQIDKQVKIETKKVNSDDELTKQLLHLFNNITLAIETCNIQLNSIFEPKSQQITQNLIEITPVIFKNIQYFEFTEQISHAILQVFYFEIKNKDQQKKSINYNFSNSYWKKILKNNAQTIKNKQENMKNFHKIFENEDIQQEMVNILKQFLELKPTKENKISDKISLVSRFNSNILILILCITQSDFIYSLKNLTNDLELEVIHFFFFFIDQSDYKMVIVEQSLLFLILQRIQENQKNIDISVTIVEFLLEMATQGEHYQLFIKQTTKYFGSLTSLMQIHLKDLEFCEKLSIIMQRILMNDPTLMNQNVKSILSSLLSSSSEFELLNSNIKSMLEL